MLGEIIFHEIGHHIHATTQPEYREREDVADEWQRRLLRAYLRRHYGYLRPLGALSSFLVRFVRLFKGFREAEARYGRVDR
jgi:hypothetical protein